MLLKEFQNKIISFGLVLFSSLIGIRLINEYLKYNDRAKYEFESSSRLFKNGSEIHVSHPQQYDITTTGENTIIFVSDSFGEGRKCGNSNNISGCLSKLNPNNKIVNLSFGGTTPAFYLQQIKTYFSAQRNSRNATSGEKVFVSLYSNDIILDPQYCEFYNSKKYKLKDLMNEKEYNRINTKCDSLLSLSPKEYRETKNFRMPFQNILNKIIGNYSVLLFREMLAQLSLKLSIDTTIGRAGYIPVWNKHSSGEVIILAEILREMQVTCKTYNCKLVITTFPNVENLSSNSNVRLSLINFSKFMENNYGIKIHDGYEPFISKKILNSSYSLTDIHSNCEGYKIYANWLNDLES
jgi:hypothetical protein